MDSATCDGEERSGPVAAHLFHQLRITILREVGKDSFLPTHSVMAGLVARGVIDRPTTGVRNLAAAQAAFNDWHEETGRPYAGLSRIVAYSVPD